MGHPKERMHAAQFPLPYCNTKSPRDNLDAPIHTILPCVITHHKGSNKRLVQFTPWEKPIEEIRNTAQHLLSQRQNLHAAYIPPLVGVPLPRSCLQQLLSQRQNLHAAYIPPLVGVPLPRSCLQRHDRRQA